MITLPAKITLATVKSFIKKNQGQLFINITSEFDGMTDGCESRNKGFESAKTESTPCMQSHSLGIDGAFFVGSSRDYFSAYSDNSFEGIKISNCCGRFILAVKK